jgi:ABC-type transport system involved in multi-copper enzyme maturation permease subunit
MTTATTREPFPARLNVMRMEWRKLRTVRSTWWILVLFAAGTLGYAVLVGAGGPTQPDAGYDPTDNVLQGLLAGQLALGVLGALTLSSEYSSGSIRATFAAVPRRGRVLAAKAVVLAAVTLVAGEALAFAAAIAFGAAAPAGVPHPPLGQPAVLRAVLLTGAYPCLIALIALGLAAVIRHTAGAIAAVVGVTFVLPVVLLPLAKGSAVMKFLPASIEVNSLAAVKPVADASLAVGHPLSAWAGFAVMCLYAAAALAAGGLVLMRRDA